MPKLLTDRRITLLAGSLIAVTLITFTALATSVSAQTPKATATATAAAATPATTPAATAAAAKATTAAATPAATKAVESADNTTMYLLIGAGVIVIGGGIWYIKRRRA